MIKEDKRVKRTHQALLDALVELTLEKGFESISIRDLTNRAGVGYATFFRHYKSKDELLSRLLRGITSDIVDMLPDLKLFSRSEETGLIIFTYMDQRTELFAILLGSGGSHQMYQELNQIAVDLSIEILQEADEIKIPIDIMAHQMVSSALSLVRWWLDNDKPHPPEKMANIYADVMQSLLTLVRKDA